MNEIELRSSIAMDDYWGKDILSFDPAPYDDQIVKDLLPFLKDIHPLNVSLPPGWKMLFAHFSECFAKSFDPKFVQIVQVKEKYGSLTVYFKDSPDLTPVEPDRNQQAQNLISKFTSISHNICAFCGRYGSFGMSKSTWILARCKEHAHL